MLVRWNNNTNPFQLMQDFRRRMDQIFEDFDYSAKGMPMMAADPFRAIAPDYTTGGPRASFSDTGTGFMLRMELPGLNEKDIQVTLNREVLTVKGERKIEVPEGYSALRQERSSWSFAKSYALPAPVDPEKVKATMSNGLLTIELTKVPEVQPRRIEVKATE